MPERMAPPHDEVATIVERRIPKIAEWIRSCGFEVKPAEPGRLATERCWGDLLIEVQRKFSKPDVAEAVKALKEGGLAWCVREMWAPATSELCVIYDKAAKLTEPAKGSGRRIAFLKAMTIAGAIVHCRDAWHKARDAWFEDMRLARNCNPDVFCDAVVDWLQRDVDVMRVKS